ncbi:PucR family transcriptional regulator [Cytobacillus gottheilii]|uniref:PucR family transcriptional regulator n=1 Tax=Cytobacillus gottheilii TaxID=859144 RepID=UPI0009B9BE9D|nr:helix-turn-helix domain-containing protein [Cytobacillus gottheilii]
MEMIFSVPSYLQRLLVSSQKGMEGIAQELADIISVPVLIADPLLNQIVSTWHKEGTKIEYIETAKDSRKLKEPDPVPCVLSAREELIQGISMEIHVDGRVRGYVIAVLDGSIPPLELKGILQYTSTLCSIELQNTLKMKQDRQRLREVFLYDLLYGNIKKREDIISYGQIWGWDFQQAHTAIVFSLKDFDYFSDDRHLIDLLFYMIEKALLDRKQRPISIKKRGEIILMYPSSPEGEADHQLEIKNFVTLITNLSQSHKLSERIAAGIGRRRIQPEEIYRSYQEAKVAYELGLLLNIAVPFFSSLGLERILYNHDLHDLKEYYENTLGVLENYDQIYETDLMSSLSVFAANQFDLTKTAEEMFVHRNTLRYRFKKIEEILDEKLDDMNIRLNIIAALKIKQLGKI